MSEVANRRELVVRDLIADVRALVDAEPTPLGSRTWAILATHLDALDEIEAESATVAP